MNAINKYKIIAFLILAVALFVGIGMWVRPRLIQTAVTAEPLSTKNPGSSYFNIDRTSSQSVGSKDKKVRPSESRLTPDLAKEELKDFFSRTPDVVKRANFACEVMRQLCENGFSEEAFQMLDESAGDVRSNEIATLFQFSEFSNSELLTKINQVSAFREDKEDALRGYLGRLKMSELAARISDPEFQTMLGSGQKLTFYTLSRNLAYALQKLPVRSNDVVAGSPPFLSAAKELVDRGFLNPSDFVSISSAATRGDGNDQSSVDVFERWRQINEVIPAGALTSGAGSSGDAGKILVSDMVTSDGPQTLSNLLQSQDYQSVSVAINFWLQSDPQGASQWYEKNAGKLDLDQSDAVTSAFSSTALGEGEIDGSRAWAERIQNSKLKEKILNDIAAKEKLILGNSSGVENGKN